MVSCSIEPEAFGRVSVEAQSMEKPIIASNIGGSKETIKDEKTGLICDGTDLNSIYEKAIHFFKDDNFIKFGKNAEKFSEDFYWDKIVKKYLKLIN